MPDEADVFVFSLWERVEDSAEWLPTSPLTVHVDDGGSVVPARLSWATEDDAQSAVGFAPDMTSCYGHRRTAGGDVVEVRGELARRAAAPEEDEGARRLEFDAEAEDAGGWHPAGPLRILIDDGSEAPVRWMSWADPLGNACSVALRSVSPSGNADVTDLADGSVRFIGYRQRAGLEPVAYRGVRRGRPAQPLPGGTVASPRPTPGPQSRGNRPAEWEGWQSGGSWLPLGGTLSMESLTSPSGRFTVLHGLYGPALAIRDNLTREHVWISDAPSSSLLSLGPDGDFAAWDHHGQRVWSTGTAWLGARRLELRDSGELALTDAHGGVVWSSGILEISPAAGGLGTVARGSTMRRGESLYGQSLTSDDGSTVLFHDGRVLRCIVHGLTSHWDRLYDRQNVVVLDEDGFLRTLALDGSEMERIAGPGAELVVARGAAELRDETGAVVWASASPSTRAASIPVREPAMPRNDALAAWFGALMGQGRGFCVAVVKETTPLEVLEGIGVVPGSAVPTTWPELRQRRDAAGEGSVAAALAVGSDVILLVDDAALPVAQLAPSASCAAVQAPSGGNGYGTRFSLHQRGKLVSEFTDQPRRGKGAKVPEVAAALDESVHHLHRYETLFRVSMVVPSAAELGGVLLGGVLAAEPTPAAASDSGDALPPLAIGQRDELSPLVIRTDFTDEDAWNRVVGELQEPWMENVSEPYLISESAYGGVPADRVLQAVLAALPEPELPGVVFIADATTMREDKLPLLAVSTEWDGEPFAADEDAFATQFRIRPNAAIEVSCNLGIGNMDFEDFAGDGVSERMVD